MGAAVSLVDGAVALVIGLVFAVYILAGKKKLKAQTTRLLQT